MKSPLVHRMEKLELLNLEDFQFSEDLVKSIEVADSGAFIIEEGCIQKQIFFVLEGQAVKYKTLEDGGRRIVNFVLPRDIVGMFFPFFQRSEHTVESIITMKLGSFPANQLLKTFRDAPRLALVLA